MPHPYDTVGWGRGGIAGSVCDKSGISVFQLQIVTHKDHAGAASGVDRRGEARGSSIGAVALRNYR